MASRSISRHGPELVRRTVASVARRIDRPELYALIYSDGRQRLRWDVARPVLLMAALRHDSTFVDVGANEGQWLRHAVRFAPSGRHIAFEPIPRLADSLAAEFPSVDVRPVALSNLAGQADFCVFPDTLGWSGLHRQPEVAGLPTWLRVDVARLDDELDGLQPDVLKIDVEGAELQVLRGAQSVLSKHRPLIIFEHAPKAAGLFGDRSLELWEFFASRGYRLFTVDGSGPVDPSEFEHAAIRATAIDWLGIPTA